MYIRGVDFSRANIIVGTDAEAPVPASGGGNKLQARDVVQARVIAAAGGEATLDIGGERVVVETHVSLNAGDKLFVRVNEGASGAIRLSILTSEPDGDGLKLSGETLDGLLRELGLPTNERTRNAARAVLARDGTLDPVAVKNLAADLRKLPGAGPREAGIAALLQKAGVPVSREAVALLAARAEPMAPPQLATRLDAVRPAVEQLARQGGRNAALATEVASALKGLPLDDRGAAGPVAAALKDWIDKLTPAGARRSAPAAPRADGSARPAPAASQPPATPTAELARAAIGNDALDLARLTGADLKAAADTQAKPAQTAQARVDAAEKQGKQGVAGAAPEADNREPVRVQGVHASPHSVGRVGINNAAPPAPAAPELALQLDRLAKSLGGEHQGLKQKLGEAVAEVRYLQLTNGPTPTGAGGVSTPEFLIPLLLPASLADQARIQIQQRARKPGEPVDPDNLQMQVVVDTEHLQTVQAELVIRDGVVHVTLGVPEAADRDFLSQHLDELKDAIARQGFEAGRLGARQAKGLPPRTRQAEGLGEVVRFDRRI